MMVLGFMTAACGGAQEPSPPPVEEDASSSEPEVIEPEDTAAEDDEDSVEDSPSLTCEGAEEGSACVSDSPCSKSGTCQAGICVPGTPCACANDSDCAPPEDLCSGVMVCDTSGDVPACVLDATQATLCPASEVPCRVNQCQPETGACTLVDAPEGEGCDDGDACTTVDTCLAGQCTGGAPLECDDGAFCNGLEGCAPDIGCVPGEAPLLDDGLECTLDSCDEAADQVLHTAQDQACSNGFFCDGEELCDVSVGCVPGEAPLVDDGVSCTDDACDEAADTVVHVANDALCNDALFCNGVESCDALLDCQAGEAPLLDDAVACTLDTCDEEADLVVHTPDDTFCSNGAFCDGEESCDATLDCQPGEAPLLDDGVACTDDACDEELDAVLHVANDALCDDALFCTGVESCDATMDCQAGEPPSLDDGVECTVDSCDEEVDVVVHTPEPSLCDDGNPCTAELCDPLAGCSHEADDLGLCSDEDPCTSGDQCVDSVCVGVAITSEGPVCNNVDDDCDGVTDEDCSYRLNGHAFGDGFGLGTDASAKSLEGKLGTPRILGTSSNGTWTLKSGLPDGKEK